MSKLLERSQIYYEHAMADYPKISNNDCYLDSCCFHLQQAIEFLLKGIVEMNGLNYAENHDIRANLNILNRANISIPYEKQIRDKAEVLYRWETESRYKDSFIAAISDIDEVIEYYDVLFNYATENVSSIEISEMDFPDSKLN